MSMLRWGAKAGGTRSKAGLWIALALVPVLALSACGKGSKDKAQSAPEGAILWKLSDADSTVWLFGTFHLLPENTDWHRPAIDKAFAASDTLILEANVDGVDQDQLVHLLQTHALAPAETALRSRLTPEQLAALEDMAGALDVPVDTLNIYEPWYAANFLTVRFAEKSGFSAEDGVEAALTKDAVAAGKSLVFLETVEEQIGFFSGMPEEAQVAMLTSTVQELKESGSTLDEMKDAWLKGDADALAGLVNGAVAEVPALYDVVIIQRNKAWADELAGLMAGQGTAFVAVGVGHLVGADSLVDQLKARGIEAERQ